jgi:hypothetical protein
VVSQPNCNEFLEDDSLEGYRRAVLLKQTDVSEVFTASIITQMMEAVRTSETSVCFHETTRPYTPEGCHLRTRRHGNLKSHNAFLVFPVSPTFRTNSFFLV